MIDLGHHFGRDESRHSEWLRQRKWFIKARENQEKREQAAEKMEDNLTACGIEMIAATQTQIRAFEVKLDTQAAATVSALMENRQQLDLVNVRIEAMLAQAYVMEDGRRVFKTEDGTQVFDENGQEVSRDELDFELIGDDQPSWEAFKQDVDRREELEATRDDILAYQERLDDARERISGGTISEVELEELDADLQNFMPDAVRTHIPDTSTTANVPELTTAFKSPAAIATAAPSSNLSASAPTPVQ